MKRRVWNVSHILFSLALAGGLVACGGGGGGTPPIAFLPPTEKPEETPKPDPVPNEPDESEQEPDASPLRVTHERKADALQAIGSPVTFSIRDAAPVTDAGVWTVYVNDALLEDSNLAVSTTTVTASAALVEGRNEVLLFAPDATGARFEGEAVIWAGSASVEGRVLDRSGNPVAGAAVIAALGDDSTVTATTTTDASGRYALSNFPARTVLISVTGSDGLPGSTAGVAGGAFPDVVLLPFGTPVATPNNDFLHGIVGWLNTNGASLTLVDHVDLPGGSASLAVPAALATPKNQASKMAVPQAAQALGASAQTQDLRVATNGHGPRTVSYTFTPPADSQTARLRYRFQTDEFPQYFGTQYNDSFSVMVRSASGKTASNSGAMNELGAGAFDASGSTSWQDLTLELTAPGEPVQVDVTVANVGDGVIDSAVIVDLVSTSAIAIESAKLFDIDNAPLQFLSAAAHTYFAGNTRVHATFKVLGPQEASLSKVELHVLQSGTVRARGALAPSLVQQVYRGFGPNGVSVATATLAFEIPSSELSNIDASKDGPLSFKIVATASDGSVAAKNLDSVPLLDKWNGSSRYSGKDGGRDEHVGGDDWTTAKLRDVVKAAGDGVRWNDFSNMNGGSFPPHTSHNKGRGVDGWYDGYNARDAKTAARMIELLNKEGVGSKLKLVYVTHEAKPGNPFYDAYKDVTLADGRKATKVIQHWDYHTGHFHWHVR